MGNLSNKNDKKNIDDLNKPNVVEKVRGLVDKNRAAALGLAVVMVLTTATAACAIKNSDEEDDDSYYVGGRGIGGYHGGAGYFYSSGSTYKTGSWSKQTYGYSGSSKSYSSSKGASIGG